MVLPWAGLGRTLHVARPLVRIHPPNNKPTNGKLATALPNALSATSVGSTLDARQPGARAWTRRPRSPVAQTQPLATLLEAVSSPLVRRGRATETEEKEKNCWPHALFRQVPASREAVSPKTIPGGVVVAPFRAPVGAPVRLWAVDVRV